ncbi:unnamed protein product [Polarella glacialis]|uniref:Uncharacterized protein n=1 Tax=Polarella glacialis TaxID=89957 RepID=A0A813LTM2_POLGL|nr:unnamed protein product [Polarella glacialis]
MAEGSRDREEGPEKIDKQMILAVRRVLQEELHEIKDLLVCLMEKQRDIHEQTQSEQCEPKLAQPRLPTPGNKRRVLSKLPRSFSRLGDSKPATIDELEEELAEQLQASGSFRKSIPLPANRSPASLEVQKKWSRSSSDPSRVLPFSAPVVDPVACLDSGAPRRVLSKLPRSFSRLGDSKPATIDELEEELAEQLQASDSFRKSRPLPAKQSPASLEVQKKWSRSSSDPSRVLPFSAPVVDPVACLDSGAPCEIPGFSAFAAASSPEPPSGGRRRMHGPGQASTIDSIVEEHVPPELPRHVSLDSLVEEHERPEPPASALVLHPSTATPAFPAPPCLQQLEVLPDPGRIAAESPSDTFKFSSVLGSVALGSVDRLWAARDEQRVRSVDRLWAARDEQHVQDQDDDGKPEAAALAGASLSCYQRCLSRSSRAVFCIFGILPMRKGRSGYLYPAVVQLAISAIATYPLLTAHSDSARPSLWSWYNNAIGCLGVVMALCSLHWKRIQILLGPDRNPLKLYSSEHGFYGHWVSTLPFDLLVAIVFLAFDFARDTAYSYLVRTRASECVSVESSSYRVGQAVGTLAFAAVMFFKMHVVSCLDLMIDDFSRKYAEHGLAQEGVLQWNLLQSTMNQAAKRLEGSFVILFAATFAGFAAVAADFMLGSVHELAPGALPVCSGEHLIWVLEPLQMIVGRALLLIYVSSRAAGLTEKCTRTRCFVNSFVLDNCVLDTERSYLVRYIDDSAAGFYIQGVKLTMLAIMKMFYGMCALTFAIWAQASGDPLTAT